MWQQEMQNTVYSNIGKVYIGKYSLDRKEGCKQWWPEVCITKPSGVKNKHTHTTHTLYKFCIPYIINLTLISEDVRKLSEHGFCVYIFVTYSISTFDNAIWKKSERLKICIFKEQQKISN